MDLPCDGCPASDPHQFAMILDQAEQIQGLRAQLIAYALGYVHNPVVAEDLVQEAFLRYGTMQKDVEHPRAWLYKVTRNLSLNHLRSRKLVVPWEDEHAAMPGEESESPRLALERLQRVDIVHSLIRDLNGREQQLLKLKFEEELSYREISERTGLSVSNVGYLLCQIVRGLQRSLREANP